MDDAVGVREGDGVADPLEDAEPGRRRAQLAHVLVEAAAAHQLHRVEEPPVG